MTDTPNSSSIGKAPATPRILIFFALLFVPGVYLVLLLSAALPIGIFLAFYNHIDARPQSSGTDGRFIFLIGIGAIIAAFACLRGFLMALFPDPRFELALPVDPKHEHNLNHFINDICATLGTAPPDAVILNAEPSFFVQNGELKLLAGHVKGRILSIGLPLLSGLSIAELRTILVHEFAHFTGNDTLYSSIVLPVYLGTQTSLSRLRAEIHSKAQDIQGELTGLIMKLPMVIPYAILFMYLKVFKLLDMKLSRIMERRADTIAALCCGSQVFSDALRKVVRLSRSFHSLSKDHIINLLKDHKAYINYYSIFRDTIPKLWEWSSQFENEALAEKQTFFSSHPTLRTRLQYIPNAPNKYSDLQPATSLIVDIEKYEKQLTDGYTEFLGIVFAEEVKKLRQASTSVQSPPATNVIRQASTSVQSPRVTNVKCPHCYMRTYDGTHCHICGKPLATFFDQFLRAEIPESADKRTTNAVSERSLEGFIIKWECPKCETKNHPNLKECYNCGQTRPA